MSGIVIKYTHSLVLSGQQTQTRIVRLDDVHFLDFSIAKIDDKVTGYYQRITKLVKDSYTQTLYGVNGEYALQPDYNKKGIGRVRVTGIRPEYLHQITDSDVLREGIVQERDSGYDGWESRCMYIEWDIYTYPTCENLHTNRLSAYRELWNKTHVRVGERWEDNPKTVVITFELVQEGESSDKNSSLTDRLL